MSRTVRPANINTSLAQAWEEIDKLKRLFTVDAGTMKYAVFNLGYGSITWPVGPTSKFPLHAPSTSPGLTVTLSGTNNEEFAVDDGVYLLSAQLTFNDSSGGTIPLTSKLKLGMGLTASWGSTIFRTGGSMQAQGLGTTGSAQWVTDYIALLNIRGSLGDTAHFLNLSDATLGGGGAPALAELLVTIIQIGPFNSNVP